MWDDFIINAGLPQATALVPSNAALSSVVFSCQIAGLGGLYCFLMSLVEVPFSILVCVSFSRPLSQISLHHRYPMISWGVMFGGWVYHKQMLGGSRG